MGGAVTEITFWPIVWNDTFNPYQPNFPHQYVGWMHSSAAGQCICSFNLKPRPVEYKMSWIYLSLCKPSPTVRLFYAVIWKMTHHHLFPLLQTAEWKVILYSKGTKGWCKDVIINIEYSDWNKLAQIWIPFFLLTLSASLLTSSGQESWLGLFVRRLHVCTSFLFAGSVIVLLYVQWRWEDIKTMISSSIWE